MTSAVITGGYFLVIISYPAKNLIFLSTTSKSIVKKCAYEVSKCSSRKCDAEEYGHLEADLKT